MNTYINTFKWIYKSPRLFKYEVAQTLCIIRSEAANTLNNILKW